MAILGSRPSSRTAHAELVAHVATNKHQGDGVFGEELDQAILELPTFQAIRERGDLVVAAFGAAVDEREPRQILAINAAAGGLATHLAHLLVPFDSVLTCLEGDRDVLGLIDDSIERPHVRLVHDDLVQVCLGRSVMHHEPQDVIVVDALTEYLPDRLVAALLDWCHDRLSPGGTLLVTGLLPAPDSALLDYVLGIPTVRRSVDDLASLLRVAGLHEVRTIAPERGAYPGFVAAGLAGIRGLARADMEA
jgi:hypothetical protein